MYKTYFIYNNAGLPIYSWIPISFLVKVLKMSKIEPSFRYNQDLNFSLTNKIEVWKYLRKCMLGYIIALENKYKA